MTAAQATVAAAIVSITAVGAAAQTEAAVAEAPPESPAVVASTADEAVDAADSLRWEFTAAVSVSIVPDAHEYAQPTFTADLGSLHLEARYNYEALETASLWAGWTFSGGESLTWEVTPMLGAVFGETDGVAPGYEATLTWGMLSLYSEGEYLFDANDSSDSFFYNWSELTLSPVEWLRFGIAAQRTRVYDSDRDIQRGPLVGLTFGAVDISAYVLDPDDQPIWVFSVEIGF